ncbi:hypothetical protein TRFO_15540 [Tritrichomonas foetus]|uniref:Uncharacterized protein n=1 Tax=Tritrichomonas foetus TaxID=1144522 RepID=A0A1J4KSZ6_9EUKA|nr:hypothetical protein TRFO_15540 [Tritrichomonas foetus]|eukprot:OHT14234.1 hypothetical protein TRFO_15540 [Tritrichomonas foetus]
MMMILFSIIALSSNDKIKNNNIIDQGWFDPNADDTHINCDSQRSIYQTIFCAVESLPTLETAARTPFSQCILKCHKNPEHQKITCITKCNDLANPSTSSKDCLLGCSSISDPTHQDQCMNKCKSSSRINPMIDFENTCDRCHKFLSFIRKNAVSYDSQELTKAFLRICPTNIKMLPICQGITNVGIEMFYELFHDINVKDNDLCVQMQLCEIV